MKPAELMPVPFLRDRAPISSTKFPPDSRLFQLRDSLSGCTLFPATRTRVTPIIHDFYNPQRHFLIKGRVEWINAKFEQLLWLVNSRASGKTRYSAYVYYLRPRASILSARAGNRVESIFQSESRFTGLGESRVDLYGSVSDQSRVTQNCAGPPWNFPLRVSWSPVFLRGLYAQATIFVSLCHVTLAAAPRYVLIFRSWRAFNQTPLAFLIARSRSVSPATTTTCQLRELIYPSV